MRELLRGRPVEAVLLIVALAIVAVDVQALRSRDDDPDQAGRAVTRTVPATRTALAPVPPVGPETTTAPATTPRPGSARTIAVRVDAGARPTFLCVEDADGRRLYNGLLSGSQTFRSSRLLLNIGLASTRVTVGGRVIALPGSPAGLDVTAAEGVRTLSSAKRPCG